MRERETERLARLRRETHVPGKIRQDTPRYVRGGETPAVRYARTGLAPRREHRRETPLRDLRGVLKCSQTLFAVSFFRARVVGASRRVAHVPEIEELSLFLFGVDAERRRR